MRRSATRSRSLVVSLAVVTAAAGYSVDAHAGTVNVTSTAELLAAIAAAKAGDEIVLADGTYAIKQSRISCGAVGTKDAPIIVRAKNHLAAKVELDTSEGFAVTGAHWRFEGLDVVGVCAKDTDCEHAFHVMGDATDFVLRNNRIVDFNAQLKANANGGKSPHRGLLEGNELYDTHARDTGNPVTKFNIDTGDDWIVRANYIHDFHRASGGAVYGAFMKSGGKNGIFERNLVVCSKDVAAPAGESQLGLSFGGGLTGPQFCAPAFDSSVPCDVEHYGGTMRNNIVASCNDAGIYIAKGKDTKVLFNTLVATVGIDFRYATTTGESVGNVLGGRIADRQGGTHTSTNDIVQVSKATFEAAYQAPLVGNLKKKGDLSQFLGKAPAHSSVTNDYCLRTRTAPFDLGAIQHSLGDCADLLPPLPADGPGGGNGQPDGGTSSSSGGAPGSGNGGSSGATPGSDDSSTGAGGEGGCNASPTTSGSLFDLALVAATLGVSLGLRRRRVANR